MGIFDVFKKKSAYDIKLDNERSFTANANTYYEAYNRYNAKDYKTAFKLYSKAAKGHHMAARYMMGACYEDGFGVERDYRKAFEIYSGIADYYEQNKETFFFDGAMLNRFGVSFSKYRIGLFYMWGRVVPQNTDKAIEIFSSMDTRYDHGEAVFFSQRELHYNYLNGSNGFPKSYGLAHNRALKAIQIYDNYKLPDKIATDNFYKAYERDHHWMLQFVAYNLENGRDVGKNLEKATKYRRRSAKEHKDANDAYWTGRNYEQLNETDKAKEMYQLAIDLNNDREYKQKAEERLGNIILREENEKIRVALEWIELSREAKKEFMAKLENNPSRDTLRNAARLYYHGILNYALASAGGKYVPIEETQNHPLALEYLIRLMKAEVADSKPLPPVFVTSDQPVMFAGKAEDALEQYVRNRMAEKRGIDFNAVLLQYTALSMYPHAESMFRRAHLTCTLNEPDEDHAKQNFGPLENLGMPVYNKYNEPTYALVQLAEKEDPEAMLDLARIYRNKKDYTSLDVAELLTAMATHIYEERADAGDPEATYNLIELKHQQRKNGLIYLLKANKLMYAKSIADFASDYMAEYAPSEDREKMRELATTLGAKRETYLSYFDKKEFEDAAATIAKEEELADKLTPPANRGSFMKLYDFMQTKKPFYDEEMQQLIKDGTVDGIGDKPLAELIKKLAAREPDYSDLTDKQKDAVMKGIREAFGLSDEKE